MLRNTCRIADSVYNLLRISCEHGCSFLLLFLCALYNNTPVYYSMMWNILWAQSVLKLGKPCFMLLSLEVYVAFCKITTQTLKKRKCSPLNTGSNNPENSIIIYHSIKKYHQNNEAIRGCLTSTTHQNNKAIRGCLTLTKHQNNKAMRGCLTSTHQTHKNSTNAQKL